MAAWHMPVVVLLLLIAAYCAGAFWTITFIIVAQTMKVLGFFSRTPLRPEIKDGWFGRGPPKEDDVTIRDFTVSVGDDVIDDLKKRLENTRYGEDLDQGTFEYGFQASYLQEVVEYWRNKYDWRKHEAMLNRYQHYKTQIEGIDVHCLVARPVQKSDTVKKNRTLLLIHGWPGSIYEFNRILPMLTDPAQFGGKEEDALDVVCPSIPGFGFSEAPHQKGFNPICAARVFKKLMQRLGYEKFYVQGGDYGALIGTEMAAMYPLQVAGVHVNMYGLDASNPINILKLAVGCIMPRLVVDTSEAWKLYPLSAKLKQLMREVGYFLIQATKPDTVGTAVMDSPSGLAAYILEKFSTWTNIDDSKLPDGGLRKHFSLDDLLTNVMIYWVTKSVTSSMRLYKEMLVGEDMYLWKIIPVQVPSAVAAFPNEIPCAVAPREFVGDKYKYLVQYTNMPRGGHFAAFEEPELLANDIQEFVRKVEAISLEEQEPRLLRSKSKDKLA